MAVFKLLFAFLILVSVYLLILSFRILTIGR